MTSPKYQVFWIYNSTTGVPVTDTTIGSGGIHFEYYKNQSGENLTPPEIENLNGGCYGFIPVLIPDEFISYTILNSNSGQMPTRVSGSIRPEEYNIDTLDMTGVMDGINELLDLQEGRWTINKTGVDANKLCIYGRTGSIIFKADLLDSNGSPTSVNPYTRSLMIRQ